MVGPFSIEDDEFVAIAVDRVDDREVEKSSFVLEAEGFQTLNACGSSLEFVEGSSQHDANDNGLESIPEGLAMITDCIFIRSIQASVVGLESSIVTCRLVRLIV